MLWVIAAAGLILVSVLIYFFSHNLAGLDAQLQSLIPNLIYYLPFVALPVYLLARRKPGMWEAYRPYPVSLLSTLSIVSLALLGVFFTTDLTALWAIPLEALGFNVSGASVAVPTTAPGLALCVFYVAVLPGVCEEFLFRGAILSAFERGGTRRAVLVAAALFVLLHGSLTGLPAQFLLGLIMGWLVVCCNSIYAGLIYHTTHNAASVILQFVISRSASGAAEGSSRMIDAVGGPAGVAQLLIELAVMGAMILFTLRMFRMTAPLRGAEFVPDRHDRLRKGEWALLIVGLIFVGLLYGSDIFGMLS